MCAINDKMSTIQKPTSNKYSILKTTTHNKIWKQLKLLTLLTGKITIWIRYKKIDKKISTVYINNYNWSVLTCLWRRRFSVLQVFWQTQSETDWRSTVGRMWWDIPDKPVFASSTVHIHTSLLIALFQLSMASIAASLLHTVVALDWKVLPKI